MAEKKINEQLAQILGLGNTPVEWPYSETALIELIQLQKEREATKQQYFRSENISKSTDLVNICLAANIPPVLIPTMLSGESPSEDVLNRLISTTATLPATTTQIQPPTPVHSSHSHVESHQQMPMQQPIMIPQTGARPPPNMQSPARPLYSGYQPAPGVRNQQYGNLGPPLTFHSQSGVHRPNSPAKIGAAAVAQLERGRYPSSPVHKRTMSTPLTSLHHTPIPHINSQSPVPNHSQSRNQSAMMGTMNSIQFINENPGKKRRRDSSEQDDEADATEDEAVTEEKPEEPQKQERKIRHTRTRSDHFIYDKKGTQSKETKATSGTSNKVAAVVKKFEDGSATPTSGPKFANNILSSA